MKYVIHCGQGSVVQWGNNWADIPAGLTNAVSVAAGDGHTIAPRAATWCGTQFGS